MKILAKIHEYMNINYFLCYIAFRISNIIEKRPRPRGPYFHDVLIRPIYQREVGLFATTKVHNFAHLSSYSEKLSSKQV